MTAILAFCPRCFLPLLLVHPPPPTLPLNNIISTLAPHVPTPFSEPPVLPVCAPAFHTCSDTVMRGRKGVLFIKSTGAGDYAWKPCLLSSISCRDLSKSLIFSGPPFPQFAGKKEPDWVIIPSAFEFSALGVRAKPRWTSASRDIPETRMRPGIAGSLLNVARRSEGAARLGRLRGPQSRGDSR